MNPYQLVESADDNSLQRALTQQLGIPQYIVMAELEKRMRVRGGNVSNPAPHRTILQEMQAGTYQPVPVPPQHVSPTRPQTVNQAQPMQGQMTPAKPSTYPNVGLQGMQQQTQMPGMKF